MKIKFFYTLLFEGLLNAVSHIEFPNQNSISENPFYAPVNTTGLLPNETTHLFKFSGSYRFSFGLITGVTFTAQSGTPLILSPDYDKPYRYRQPMSFSLALEVSF